MNTVMHEVITGFLSDLRQTLNREHPDIVLSAAINKQSYIPNIGYDLATWSENGYFDFFVPQIYVWPEDRFADYLKDNFTAAGKDSHICPGIDIRPSSVPPEENYPEENLKEKVRVAKDVGATGVVFFDYRWWDDFDPSVVIANTQPSYATANGYYIRGRVFTGHDEPFENTQVLLLDQEGQIETQIDTTDEEGRYVLYALPGIYNIIVTNENGITIAEKSVTIHCNTEFNIQIETSLNPSTNLIWRFASVGRPRLLWEDNSDETRFKILYAVPGSGHWTLLRGLPADFEAYTLSKVLTSIFLETTYDVKIRAVKPNPESGVFSADSNVIQVTVPARPTDLSVEIENGKPVLNWVNNSSVAASFWIYRQKQGKDSERLEWVGTEITGYTDETAQQGTTYFYWVQAAIVQNGRHIPGGVNSASLGITVL